MQSRTFFPHPEILFPKQIKNTNIKLMGALLVHMLYNVFLFYSLQVYGNKCMWLLSFPTNNSQKRCFKQMCKWNKELHAQAMASATILYYSNAALAFKSMPWEIQSQCRTCVYSSAHMCKCAFPFIQRNVPAPQTQTACYVHYVSWYHDFCLTLFS